MSETLDVLFGCFAEALPVQTHNLTLPLVYHTFACEGAAVQISLADHSRKFKGKSTVICNIEMNYISSELTNQRNEFWQK